MYWKQYWIVHHTTQRAIFNRPRRRSILENCPTWESISVAEQQEEGIPLIAAQELEMKNSSAEYTGMVSYKRMMLKFEHILHVGPVEKHSDKTVQDLQVGRWRATLNNATTRNQVRTFVYITQSTSN